MAAEEVSGPGRVGLYGGTFDPPHVGHALVALDLVDALRLDRLLVVPAGDPPHRDTYFSAAMRLSWVRRLFAGTPGVEVSDLEVARDGPSYMVDTLLQVRSIYAPDELFLVMGVDQFRLLDTWHRFEQLADLATITVMRRSGDAPALPDTLEGQIPYISVDVTRIDVSSSRVRERLSEGRSIRFAVPESIRVDVERAWTDLAPSPAHTGTSC